MTMNYKYCDRKLTKNEISLNRILVSYSNCREWVGSNALNCIKKRGRQDTDTGISFRGNFRIIKSGTDSGFENYWTLKGNILAGYCP